MRLVLLGPPGAGKGTQAKVLSQRLGIPAVSTGDIFRSNIAGGTPLGREVQGYLDRGDYVPDSVTNAMVRDRLAEPDAAVGFLLDGYPRTTAQVDELDAMLTGAGTKLDRVVEITVDHDEVVARLTRRAAAAGAQRRQRVRRPSPPRDLHRGDRAPRPALRRARAARSGRRHGRASTRSPRGCSPR